MIWTFEIYFSDYQLCETCLPRNPAFTADILYYSYVLLIIPPSSPPPPLTPSPRLGLTRWPFWLNVLLEDKFQ